MEERRNEGTKQPANKGMKKQRNDRSTPEQENLEPEKKDRN